MSEFRRFISYIYSYHKADKLKNTGFAKIEARGETCRMEVHIKGAYPINLMQCNVYGFYRKNGLIRGILLGKFILKNGNGDFRIVTDRNKIGNTSKSLEELGGIYITLNEEEDNAMASEWDNEAVDTSYFKVHDEEETEERIFPSELDGETDSRSESDGIVGEVEKIETVEKVKTMEETETTEAVKESAEQQEEKTFEAREAEEIQKKPTEANEAEKLTGNMAETGLQEEIAEKLAEEDRKEEVPEKNKETVLNEQSVLCGEIMGNVDKEQKKDVPCGEKADWETLLKEYPVVNPFAGLDNVEVIRIQPKDIGRLSRKYWVLGSNSFLLHGYCSYRYLILGRNIRENTFFIGIPGVFHPREKMMAAMFGFNEFRMSRNGRLRQGEFGYYIRLVELEG